MPTPLELLQDPISIAIIIFYLALMTIEAWFPARDLPKIKGWIPRAVAVFVFFFFLSSYLPLVWDKYLQPYQLLDISHLGVVAGTLIGLLVFEFMVYIWHRTLHASNFLWRGFHQMHHSAERLDSFGAFYFSPLDIAGFTMVGSLSLVLVVGISPVASTAFLFITFFLGVFQHMNVNTPRWLGYFIQRPESHSVHHGKGIHRHNYADFPIFDMLFGTFENPHHRVTENGFYEGASAQIPAMLLGKDLSANPISVRAGNGAKGVDL